MAPSMSVRPDIPYIHPDEWRHSSHRGSLLTLERQAPEWAISWQNRRPLWDDRRHGATRAGLRANPGGVSVDRPSDRPAGANLRHGDARADQRSLGPVRSDGHPDFVWSSLSVLVAVWRMWRHDRIAWILLTVTTPVALLLYGLSISGVINTGLPGWWVGIGVAADIVALAILLSPFIRRWVAKQSAPDNHGNRSRLCRSLCMWRAMNAE